VLPLERHFKLASPEGLHSYNWNQFNRRIAYRFPTKQSNAAVRVRVTRILLNYRRVRVDGQRLRCAICNSALSNRNICWPFQQALDEHMQRFGQGVALALHHGWFFLQQARRKFCPGRRCGSQRVGRSTQHQSIGTV
jgi:hypothetical protein